MISISKFLLSLFILIGCSISARAQYNWELKNQEAGITVYTSAVAGSGFKAFKGVITISASGLHELVAILLDVDNYNQLFPDIQESFIIKKSEDGPIIHYILNNAPWPVDDREGIFEIRPEYHKTEKVVILYDKCIQSDYPQKSGTVRMHKGEGFWKVAELKNNLFEITYQYHGDPAGNIPAWLANSFVVDHPFKTLQNMKGIVASGKYKNAKVSFIN